MRFMVMRKAERDTTADARVTFREGRPAVTHGPFAAAGPLMAGYTMIDAASKEDAVAWARRQLAAAGDSEVEIREVGCVAGLAGVSPPDPIPEAGDLPRYFVLLKATPEMEAGFMPDAARVAAMAQRNDEAVRAGVMLAGDGLQPSSHGARVRVSAGKTTVMDGPFTEAKELIAGFWLIEVRSKEDAIEWVRNYPYPIPDAEIEIRLVTGAH